MSKTALVSEGSGHGNNRTRPLGLEEVSELCTGTPGDTRCGVEFTAGEYTAISLTRSQPA